LYQVATGQLSPEDIAYPIRSVFAGNANVTVLKGMVQSVDVKHKRIQMHEYALFYDYLIISSGVVPDYFGNEKWANFAPGLKTIQDALYMRMRILNAFERAEREHNPDLLNFVIIGGGPTGVELSGALAELSREVLKNDFRNVRTTQANIYLIEAGDHILNGFPEVLIKSAKKKLIKLSVIVLENTRVMRISSGAVEIKSFTETKIIKTETVLWAAGVKAADMRKFFKNTRDIEFDKKNRIIVNNDLTVGKHKDIFAIGDLVQFKGKNNFPLPGIAPVAMQQGRYAARKILSDIDGNNLEAFHYRNKGKMAVIGRNAAIVDFGFLQVGGFFAWLIWIFIHIAYLIGFQKKFLVLLNWAWNYFKKNTSARIVFGCEDKDGDSSLQRDLNKEN